MSIEKTWFIASALGAVSLASLKMASGALPAAAPPAAPRYETSCAVIEPGSADGYVTNLGQDTLQVLGPVRFIFPETDSMSRPAIVYTANNSVPAGQTVRVARVKLAFEPLPGSTCRFEVKDAIRKE